MPAGGLTNQNFGETTGSLSGTVFFDGNNDGIQETGEPGIPGVTVRSPAPTSTATGQRDDHHGRERHLQFRRSAGGESDRLHDHRNPAGQLHGRHATRPAALAAASSVQDVISAIGLDPGQNAPGYNFAEQGTVVAGTVFLDLNKNGSLDPGEPGLAACPSRF